MVQSWDEAHEEQLKRNREIQHAYRDRNRASIDHANKARAILVRQKRYGADMEALASEIGPLLGKFYTRDLIDELEMYAATTNRGAQKTAGGKKGKTAPKVKPVVAKPAKKCTKLAEPETEVAPDEATAPQALVWVKMAAKGTWRARIAGGDDYWIGKRGNGVFTVSCEPHPIDLMRGIGTAKTLRAAKALAERDYKTSHSPKLAEPAKLPRALKWKRTDPGMYMADLGDGFGFYQIDHGAGGSSATYFEADADANVSYGLGSRKTLNGVKKVCEDHWAAERQRLVQA
jgi:hypothetical protein